MAVVGVAGGHGVRLGDAALYDDARLGALACGGAAGGPVVRLRGAAPGVHLKARSRSDRAARAHVVQRRGMALVEGADPGALARGSAAGGHSVRRAALGNGAHLEALA
eukprot:2063211-Lingulodinium_polyedra.AAC.1